MVFGGTFDMLDERFVSKKAVLNRSSVNRGLQFLVDRYMEWHAVEGHSPTTIWCARKHIQSFEKFLASRDLDSLEPEQIESHHVLGYMAWLKDERQVRPQTIKSRHATLRAFFRWAELWEYIPRDPVSRIKPPRVPVEYKEFLPPEQFQALLNQCHPRTFVGARRRLTLWLLRTTGMRIGELNQLQVEDIDVDRRLVQIRKDKNLRPRSVPLHREALLAFNRYMAHRREVERPELILSWSRRPMESHMLAQDVKRVMQYAGVEVRDRCHIFRRTFAALALSQHRDDRHIMAVAGWTGRKMLDHYAAGMRKDGPDNLRDLDPFGKIG